MPFLDGLREAVLRGLRPGMMAPMLRLELFRLRFDCSLKWQSQRLLLDAGLRLSLRAYRGRAPVVYTNLITPPELLHGLGFVPFGLEAAGGASASLGLSIRALDAAEGLWAPVDSCSFLRAALGAAQLGLLPKPTAVVCTSCLCDATSKVFEAIADRAGVPFYLLDVPYVDSVKGVAYLANQLAQLAADLSALKGDRYEPSRITLALRLSNEAREHLTTINELRQAHPGLLDAEVALSFLYPISLLLGSAAGSDVFRSYWAELSAAASHLPVGIPRLRLLWLYLMPYYPHGLRSRIESAGASVVFEEMSQVYWDTLDPAEPFISLARRILGHFAVGPQERRIDRLLRLARDFHVDAAVQFSQHGCRQSWGALKLVHEALAGIGVPLVELEGDCVDPRDSHSGQQGARLEAMIELLREERVALKRALAEDQARGFSTGYCESRRA